MKEDLLDDIFDLDITKNPPMEKTVNNDVLALSCCAHRLAQNRQSFGFDNSYTVNYLNEDDIRLADDIRKYYAKKYMWRSLKGEYLSDFQRDLIIFISQPDKRKYTDKQEGLIHKLPGFYLNDIVEDEIFARADNSPIDEIHVPPQIRQKTTRSLKPVNVIEIRTRREKKNKYWLKDDRNRMHLLEVNLPNTLEHLWRDLFDSQASMNIEADYFPAQHNDRSFYKVKNWRLEK
jgi:hypothetical protein